MLSNSLRSVPAVARDLMAPQLQTIAPEIGVSEGLQMLLKQKHSGMPVVDGAGKYLGVFSEKCCLRALQDTTLFESWAELPIRATKAMATKLFCLTPDEDAITAIGALLKHRVSGAPVTDLDYRFRGVFSEKTSMRVLIGAAYDSLPSANVSAFMDCERGRLIDESTSLAKIAKIFADTSYRRLPIVREDRVVGQVSRGDILRVQVEMPKATVAEYMDRSARTITESADMLSIAEIFLNTPYRRLPILRGSELVGQVSRRDVLKYAYHLMDPQVKPASNFLYISALQNDERERFAAT